MATTKDSEEVEKKTEEATVVAAQPQVTEQPKKPESRQTILILASVSAFVMLFIGFGLGYWLGYSSTSRGVPTDMMRFRDDNGGGRRFYPNSGTKDTTDSGTSSTTTPETQSN